MSEYSDDHLDHSFEVSLDEVKSRATRGVVAIMGRGFFLSMVAQIAQFFLLAFMSVDQMGVFWIVSAAVGFLIFFSDVGLAAALIQKQDKPTDEDLKTTFTVQQTLVILLLIVLYLLTPYFKATYNLSQEGIYLMYALGISLLLSSLKSIPSVLLERKLEFTKFIIPEMVESMVYSVSVVFFAWKGLGLMSFTYAVLLRGVTGVIVIYILQPWRPGFAFSKKSLSGLFKFGVPYQVNTFISIVKDRGVTLALGAVIGASGVGYLGTAERISQMPLRQFMDPVTKVSFPAFSRMQEHKTELENSVTKSLLLITFLVFPAAVGLFLVAPFLIKLIPHYEKWEPSITPLGFMVINVLWASFTTQLTNMLMAIGKIKTVSKLITMWAVLTVILVPGLGHFYGVNGASAAYAIVSSTSVIAVWVAKKYVNFSLTDSVFKTGAATLILAITVIILKLFVPVNWAGLVILIFVGGLSYFASSYLLIGPKLLVDVKRLSKIFLGRE